MHGVDDAGDLLSGERDAAERQSDADDRQVPATVKKWQMRSKFLASFVYLSMGTPGKGPSRKMDSAPMTVLSSRQGLIEPWWKRERERNRWRRRRNRTEWRKSG